LKSASDFLFLTKTTSFWAHCQKKHDMLKITNFKLVFQGITRLTNEK
jgi:hypothetical protein